MSDITITISKDRAVQITNGCFFGIFAALIFLIGSSTLIQLIVLSAGGQFPDLPIGIPLSLLVNHHLSFLTIPIFVIGYISLSGYFANLSVDYFRGEPMIITGKST